MLFLLYIGPEVVMPVLSAVAAAVGVVLIVGKRIFHWFRTAGRRIASLFSVGRAPNPEEGKPPELD